MHTRAQAEPDGATAVEGPAQGTRQKRRASSVISETELTRETTPQPRKRQRRTKRKPSEAPSEVVASENLDQEPGTTRSSFEIESTLQSQQVVFTNGPITAARLTPPESSPPQTQKETGVLSYFRGLLTPNSTVKAVRSNGPLPLAPAVLATPQRLITESDSSPISDLLDTHVEETQALHRAQHRAILKRFEEVEVRNEKLEEIRLTLDTELDKRAKEIVELEGHIEDLENTVEQQNTTIAEYELMIAALEQEKQDNTTSIARLKNALESYRADLSSTEHLLERTQNEHADAIAQLNVDHDAAIKALNTQLGSAGKEANELRMKLFEVQEARREDQEQHEQLLESMQAEHEETMTTEMGVLGKEIEAKDTAIAARDAEIEAKEKEIEEMGGELDAKDGEIARLKELVRTIREKHRVAAREWSENVREKMVRAVEEVSEELRTKHESAVEAWYEEEAEAEEAPVMV